MDRISMIINNLIMEQISGGETAPVKLVEYADGQLGVGIYYMKLIKQYFDNEYNREVIELIGDALEKTQQKFEKEIQYFTIDDELDERVVVLLIDNEELAIPIKDYFMEQICPELSWIKVNIEPVD